ncbi:MAG: GNAT family N-acetyltransferase [Xanthomonadaceae bacterium]|nr:GNAT family N-acetyltransferase [Xanthomonadaceae bacterium]MDE2083582.1 GNAT family N-acetyltransferase [Xanthomonadaceae bacterium]
MTHANAVRIRAARADDLETLTAFNAAMARETENKALDPIALRAGVARVLAEPARGFYRVAEVDAAVVGCLMVTFEWSDWRNGDWWWLQSVYIAPEYRRHGVFRALYAEVERCATGRADVVGIRLYVEQGNVRAQRTYAALGMHEDQYRMYAKTLRADVRALLGD